MKRFLYLKKDYINKYFCHELFHNVFILLNYEGIKQVSLVCRLWYEHVQQMRNTLFRRFYDSLGGNSQERTEKVLDWEKELKFMLNTCKSDLELYKYALEVGDDYLLDSVLEDGGMVMDVCKYVVETGGRVGVANLLIHFQKQVSTQTQKSEIIDIIDYMCDTLNCVDGDDGDADPVEFVCLKDFLEQGVFIKEVRMFFLMNDGQINSVKLLQLIHGLCMKKKYPDSVKKEITDFLEIVADRIDEDLLPAYYTLKKAYTTKRLM